MYVLENHCSRMLPSGGERAFFIKLGNPLGISHNDLSYRMMQYQIATVTTLCKL